MLDNNLVVVKLLLHHGAGMNKQVGRKEPIDSENLCTAPFSVMVKE